MARCQLCRCLERLSQLDLKINLHPLWKIPNCGKLTCDADLAVSGSFRIKSFFLVVLVDGVCPGRMEWDQEQIGGLFQGMGN